MDGESKPRRVPHKKKGTKKKKDVFVTDQKTGKVTVNGWLTGERVEKQAVAMREKLLKEINQIKQRIEKEAPKSGTNPLEQILQDPTKYKVAVTKKQKFSALPISKKTLKGLEKAQFTEMTDIQRAALPHALAGRDILGAAKTGSGKTLAFLIPILEALFLNMWTHYDGLGALVITPTRELALQIFQVLRKIGTQHTFSAGLVIGGKDVHGEAERINGMNILICTPGRLLQHMDTTRGFDCSNLKLLVLDEADRILDMGFQRDLNAIVENLPKDRQTLLFSATQTKSVKDLGRLSLKDPEYISVHEQAETSTPQDLKQSYINCELFEKIDVLFSFLKTHVKSKTIVFLSSCKQVRFIFSAFCKMQPGVPLLELTGKMKQPKRMSIYTEFCQKKYAVLFATDIAARGLDFPNVDWVIQADCPDDVDSYIHRVGRTARYKAGGNSLLLLLPSELKMLDMLQTKKVPMKELKINPTQIRTIRNALAAMCANDVDIKYLAQKSFVSYMRSVYLMPNKEVFDFNKLPAEEYAYSLGLASTPVIKLNQGKQTTFQRKDQETKAQEKKQEAEKQAEVEEKDKEKAESSDSGSNSDSNSDSDSDSDSESEAETKGKEAAKEDGDGKQESGDEQSGSDFSGSDSDESDSNSDGLIETSRKKKKKKSKTKLDKLFGQKNRDVLAEHNLKLRAGDEIEKEEDEFLEVKRIDHELEGDDTQIQEEMLEKLTRKAKKAKLKPDAPLGFGNKQLFDEEGKPTTLFEKIITEKQNENDDFDTSYTKEERDKYFEQLKKKLREEDKLDKKLAKDRLKEKRLDEKRKRLQLARDQDEDNSENDEFAGLEDEYSGMVASGSSDEEGSDAMSGSDFGGSDVDLNEDDEVNSFNLNESDEDLSDEPVQQKPKFKEANKKSKSKNKKRSRNDSEDSSDDNVSNVKPKNSKKPKISLEDKEKLAMSLLEKIL